MHPVFLWLLILFTGAGSAFAVPYLSPDQLLPLFGIPMLICIISGLLLAWQADALKVHRVFGIPTGVFMDWFDREKRANLCKPVQLGWAQIMLISAAIPAGAALRLLAIVYA